MEGSLMRFGIHIPPFGPLSDPRALADLAIEAEQAGWDGFFLWDGMTFDPVILV
jgi:alkanesulfonate monooxygenase SsuD/methylene tetrahydromethanopterin reductase-like flavin-dependent oxidoreductase (luciferase family)